MFEKLIQFAINQRALVLLAALGMALAGGLSYQQLPIDAVPDITNVQVQINTEAPGYSPLEAEQRITFPIETLMSGLPNLQRHAGHGPDCHGSGRDLFVDGRGRRASKKVRWLALYQYRSARNTGLGDQAPAT